MLFSAEPLSRARSATIRWLWEPYLPRGLLAVLDGDPGVGKSLIAIDIAARLSRGGELPGGHAVGRPHVTLLFSAEDSVATVRPRAEAAGADLDRVITVTPTDNTPLTLPAQLPALEKLVSEHQADLVIIDPMMAFLPVEVAMNMDQCVRQALVPLAGLAERRDCAILLIRHLRKDRVARALQRGMGSIGIIGAARTGLFAAHHPKDPTLNVLSITKSNVTGTIPSIGYRIRSTDTGSPVLEWTSPVAETADDLNRTPCALLRPRQRAVAWLQLELANGPRKANELYAEAAEMDIPEAILQRAKAELRLGSKRVSEDDRQVWYWYDPSAPWPKDAPFKQPGVASCGLPPLEDLW